MDDVRNIRSFIFHVEWKEALTELSADERLLVYDAILNYAFVGKYTPMPTSASRVAMRMIESMMDADIERKERANAVNRANGKLGGRPRKDGQKNRTVCDTRYDNQQVSVKVAESEQEQSDTTALLFDLPPVDPNAVAKTSKGKKAKTDDKELFEKCWVAYGRKGVKKPAFTQWVKLSDDDRRKAERHIPFYVKSTERQFQKDFERYLLHRVFESPVYERNTGALVYDPSMFNGDKYTPQGNSVWYDDASKSYWTSDPFYDGVIYDGYDDNNRPDGAEITLNNARGTLRWNGETKKWDKIR